MPVSATVPHPVQWHSARSLLLHLALAAALPMCAAAAWWQVERALAGNTLSWLYVFEWPAFAALSVWFWWVMVTAPSRRRSEAATSGSAAPAPVSLVGRGSRGRELIARRSVPPRWEPASESAPLRAYNSYLRQLADRPSGAPAPRRPRVTTR